MPPIAVTPPVATSLAAISTQPVPASSPQPRLVQAAHEFEAQMMKELLRPLTRVEDHDGDDSDVGSGGALADFAVEALGQSLSTRGGLGIATSIVHSLSHIESASRSPSNQGSAAAFSTDSAVVPVK
jgi:Rod binding domain-containing protein